MLYPQKLQQLLLQRQRSGRSSSNSNGSSSSNISSNIMAPSFIKDKLSPVSHQEERSWQRHQCLLLRRRQSKQQNRQLQRRYASVGKGLPEQPKILKAEVIAAAQVHRKSGDKCSQNEAGLLLKLPLIATA